MGSLTATWVTYPITYMLEMAWKSVGVSNQLKKPPSPYVVESIAALEHTLVYAFTGSAKVLSKGVMEPLMISWGLIDQGFPTVLNVISLKTNV